MDPSFGERHLNEGFSGGEKKRNEILQLAMLEPELAILDETDSGLDIDALARRGRAASSAVRQARPELGVLVVTHYQRILDRSRPTRPRADRRADRRPSGGPELADRLEAEGYDPMAELTGR